MIPTPHTATAKKRQAIADPTRNRFPLTDYHYHSIALDGYRGHCAKRHEPSFRNISRNYFDTEARHSFVGEAAFFGMIIITSALPILNSIHALADFIRAIGSV